MCVCVCVCVCMSTTTTTSTAVHVYWAIGQGILYSIYLYKINTIIILGFFNVLLMDSPNRRGTGLMREIKDVASLSPSRVITPCFLLLASCQ